MKHLALILALAVMPTFALSVHKTETMTNVGLIQSFTVRDNGSLCLLDYNLTMIDFAYLQSSVDIWKNERCMPFEMLRIENS